MKRFLIVVFVILISVLLLTVSFFAGWIASINYHPVTTEISQKPVPLPDIDQDKLWSLVQDWRVSNNLQPYTKNQNTCGIAELRVDELQTKFSHDGIQKYWKNIPDNSTVAENLSEGYSNEQEVLDAWIASPTHAKYLKSNFQYACIVCKNNFCAHEFATY